MATETRPMPGPLSGLSVKLLGTITLVILVLATLVYLPAIASFRRSWLEDRLRIGVVATHVIEAVPDLVALPPVLTDRLLNSAGAKALVYRRNGQSQLISLTNEPMPRVAVTADMRTSDPLHMIAAAIGTMVSGGDRTLRIVGDAGGPDDGLVEVLMSEAPLKHDLLAYSRNALIVSLVVAALTGLVIFGVINRLLVAPIRRMTANLVSFRQAPENAMLILEPSRRRDEIGVVERELAAMESDIFAMLHQRRHLADLGLAVAKINHDLRNTLTSAQLLSDQVANLPDPKVQRLAPRLVQTLNRAIGFAQSVLDYGRQSASPPKPVPVDLRALAEEAIFDARLVAHPDIGVTNAIPDGVTIVADPDQMARVLVNLLKNAREAIEAANPPVAGPAVRIDYAEQEDWLVIAVSDNGPGLPPRARQNLFVAFEGSARSGGTGLGLAIARELIEAHGGRLDLAPQPVGTRFEIALPASMRR